MPAITRPVVLDGTTQPGYAGTPVILIDGNGVAGDGLFLSSNLTTSSAGTTITGLDIFDFAGNGIHIQTAGNVITRDTIGTTFNGTNFVQGQGNHTGILIDQSGTISDSNNTIGGTSAGAGNVIAFNTNTGGTGVGVDVASGVGNAIRGNSMFSDDTEIVLGALANNNQPAHDIDRRDLQRR